MEWGSICQALEFIFFLDIPDALFSLEGRFGILLYKHREDTDGKEDPRYAL